MSSRGTEEQKCPVCSHPEAPIVERRGSRRRRECGLCHHRWTTYEVPAERLEQLERIEHYAAGLVEAINEGD